MSNRAYLNRTKFEGESDEVSWGWRMGDDYFRSYSDHCDEPEVPTDPLKLLAKAVAEATQEERDLFESILIAEKGITINGSWHDFEEIVAVLRAALDEED